MGDPTDWSQRRRLQRRARNLVSRRTRGFIGVLALLALIACDARTQDIDVDLVGVGRTRLKAQDTLRVNLATEPPTLDWQKANDTTSSSVLANIMQGLVRYDLSSPTLALKAALAEKWEPRENGRIWKFTLRENVKWSDGAPFTAQHVIDGWRRLLARETGAEDAYRFFVVKNAEAFNRGAKSWDEVGAKITGPREITVELERPLAYFPYLLVSASTFPARLDVIAKYGDRWTDPGHIVTLGAYQLKAWSHDRLLVLERNPLYYTELAHTRYVVVYMINEQATAINLFDSGRLDATHALPSIEVKRQRQRAEYREMPLLRIAYYGMNVTKHPMNNRYLRQAISHAIDRNELTQMLAGGQRPLTGWVPSGMLGYEPEVGLKFDIQLARELLKKSGVDPVHARPIELKFNTNEDWQRVAENIQAQVKRNLGLNLELKSEDWKVFLSEVHTDAPQIFRLGWSADYPDPDTFMRLMTSSSENNFTRWKSAAFDRLVDNAASSVDTKERLALYHRAAQLLTEDEVPVLPLFTNVDHALISKRTRGYPMNALLTLDFEGVDLQ